jgi:hypothetical protein
VDCGAALESVDTSAQATTSADNLQDEAESGTNSNPNPNA